MELPSLLSSLDTISLAGGEESRNWQELPRDVMVTILMKLEPREILESMQLVCKSWHEACKDPAAWTKIEIDFSGDPDFTDDYLQIAEAAVNRSAGHLLEISLADICHDELLLLIAKRSSNLRCLRVRCCYGMISEDAFLEAFGKLPLLEEIEFTITELGSSVIRFVGQSCPKLVSFKLNQVSFREPDQCYMDLSNEEALAIAEAMPRIRHLQLIGSMMTNEGLQAILDNCSCLESLDLRACDQVDLSGDLGKRCEAMVRVLKWPRDSTSDILFNCRDDWNNYATRGDEDDEDEYEDDDGSYGYFDKLEYDAYMGNYDNYFLEDDGSNFPDYAYFIEDDGSDFSDFDYIFF